MKTILVMGLLTLTSSAFATVVKSQDAKKGCTLYRVIHKESKPQAKNESVFLNKEVYGIGFENMEIDFDNREARVDVVMNVVLGFNRNIAETKSTISADNAQFGTLVNQLNRKVSLLERVCLNANNEIIYAKTVESN